MASATQVVESWWQCRRCHFKNSARLLPCPKDGCMAGWEPCAPPPAMETTGLSDEAEDAPAAPSAPADTDGSTCASASPQGWVCQECGRRNPESRIACIDCPAVRPDAPVAVLKGDGWEQVVVPGGEFSVGRITVPCLRAFPNVSRNHAYILDDFIIDRNSTNGTWMVTSGGLRRLETGKREALADGSVIQLGNNPSIPNARFTFVISQASQ